MGGDSPIWPGLKKTPDARVHKRQRKNGGSLSRSESARTFTAPIAIDGPAGSGKSSVGKALASRIGFRFLDTGLMYRAATWYVVKNGIDVRDPDAVTMAVSRMEYSVADSDDGDNLIVVNGEDVTGFLHSTGVDDSVSAVSAIGGVRDIMVAEQRRLAGDGEIVMVGRDIGTVVVPAAPLKIYLTATARTRAIRRHRDFVAAAAAGEETDVDFDEILRSIEQRDLLDSSRDHSPLRPADDALVLDTDGLSFDEVVDRLVELAGATD